MRYDLCSPRQKKDGGTFWHRIGTMFADDKGGFSILLDSAPFPDKEGRVMVKAFQQKERGAPFPDKAPAGVPDDEIPF